MSKSKKTINHNAILEDYLNSLFKFRYNTIKGRYEVARYDEGIEGPFAVVTDRFVNSLKRKAATDGLLISKSAIQDIIESDFSPEFNPIENYFMGLADISADGMIEKMANTIKTNNKKWLVYFRRWLIGCIANVFEPGCKNHTMLVLSGKQGTYKTTWIENICPPELSSDYLYSGKIQLDSKDTLTLLAEYFIINIDDQLTQLNRRDENDIKNLITISAVKYRKPYAHFVEEYNRIANFTATVNQVEFLTDPTGSRRFLAFETSNIDINEAKKLDVDLVWAEAYKAYKKSERYWFTSDEINELSESNSTFEVVSIEDELIKTHFVPYSDDKFQKFNEWQITDISLFLQNETNLKNISERKLGHYLLKNGFKKYQIRDSFGTRKWVYKIYLKDQLKQSEIIYRQELAIPSIPY